MLEIDKNVEGRERTTGETGQHPSELVLEDARVETRLHVYEIGDGP